MKNGAPISGGDDADLQLAGPGDDPADDVGAEQQDRGRAPSTTGRIQR